MKKSILFATTVAMASAVNQQDVNLCFSVDDCSCDLTQNNNNLWSVLTGEYVEADVDVQATNKCRENQAWFDKKGASSANKHYKRTAVCNEDGFVETTVHWYPTPATRPTDGYCSSVPTHTTTLIADGRCRITEGPTKGTYLSYSTVSKVPCTNALLRKYSATGCAPKDLKATPTYQDLMYVADTPKRSPCTKVTTGDNYYTTHSRCNKDGILETAVTVGQTLSTCETLAYPTAGTWYKHDGKCTADGADFYMLPVQHCVPMPESTSATDYQNNIAFFEGQTCENKNQDNQHTKKLRETLKGIVPGFECIIDGTESYRISSFCNVNGYITSVRSIFSNTKCLGTPIFNEEFTEDTQCHGYVGKDGANLNQKLFSYRTESAEITKCNDDHYNIFSSNDCTGYPLESGFVTAENGTCVKQFGQNKKVNHGCTSDGLFLTSTRTPYTTNDCGTEKTVGIIEGVPEFIHDGNCHRFISGSKQYSYKASLSECRPEPAFTWINGIDDDKTAMIAGIVVGGCGCLFIIFMVIVCLCCKKEEPAEETPKEEEK
eukprot:TRINITY_DN2009_c0_g1_i1.p1 TRINITY_DN2009_c0_g1~~TRINITY_DN2009_c0_g1_i1.p1  ORF type:complete len:546 (+),score=144.16 TRINITY_DN2009_c0_g1_i1:51-1688(+)